MIDTHKVAPIAQLLEQTRRIVLTIHYNPDGDSLGSSLSLWHLFRDLGHSVCIIAPNTPTDSYKWMPSFDQVLDFSKNPETCTTLIQEAELIFSLDYNELSRAGKLEELLRQSEATFVLIDHHPDPEHFTPYVFSDTQVSSASELTYEFIRALYPTKKISKTTAECIFTGIMTDTGMFNHNSSRPETFRIVADLLECGIDKDRIKGAVFDTSTVDRMRLMGFSLSERMVIIPELHAGYIALSKADMARFNFKKGDHEGLVNYPLKVEGVCFSALVVEQDDLVKMSLRSKGLFDVNALVRKHFEGGGHKNAAGARSYESFEATLTKLESVLRLYQNELTDNLQYC